MMFGMERKMKLMRILWAACIGLCAFNAGQVLAENDDAINEDHEPDRIFEINGNHIRMQLLQIQQSINTMTKTMEQLQDKIDGVSTKVELVKNEVQELKNKVEEGNNKVEVVKNEVQEVKNKTEVVSNKFEEVNNKITKYESVFKVQILKAVFRAGLEDARMTKQYNSNGSNTIQDGDCGGIIVAEKGSIFYHYNPSRQKNLSCIWTIQANNMTTISYKFLDDDFGCKIESSVTLFSLVLDEHGRVFNYNSKKISAGGREGTWDDIRGPLLFVTFDFRPSVTALWNCNIAGFELRFEGSEEHPYLNNRRYTHMQYADSEGSVAYPFSGGKYLPDETVTFVINPTAVPIYVNLHYLHTEENWDILTFFTEAEYLNNSIKYSLTPQNLRYTGKHGSVNVTIKPLRDGSPFIAFFSSDRSTEYEGIKFSWRSS